MRPDLSTVVISPYQPCADEPRIAILLDEQLQDEYMKVFAKIISAFLRHQRVQYRTGSSGGSSPEQGPQEARGQEEEAPVHSLTTREITGVAITPIIRLVLHN